MKDLSAIRARYVRDPLPVRLGGLAADMARITLQDETFAVLASFDVEPSCGLKVYALGTKLDKSRFRAGV